MPPGSTGSPEAQPDSATAAASMRTGRSGPRRDARPWAETDAEALEGDSVKTSLDSE